MIQNIFAQFDKVQNCPNGESSAFNPKQSGECLTNLPQVAAGESQLKTILAIVFAVAAAVALISLMIAAINFATAATDHEKIARSRQAIVFSLLGLVIALSAEAIVLTVVGKL